MRLRDRDLVLECTRRLLPCLGSARRAGGQVGQQQALDARSARDLASLGRQQMTHLKVYGGADHPHEAQQPEPLDVAAMNRKNKRTVRA